MSSVSRLVVSFLPASATADTRRLITTRALRGFADGLVSVLLAKHLSVLQFTPVQIGAIVTGTLLGSAALTLLVGLFADRLSRRWLLLAAAAAMFATGLGFFEITSFWPLLLVAVLGTLNPSSGDVSVFLPTEQAVLSETVASKHLTAAFARYNLAGNVAGALGSLASGSTPRFVHEGDYRWGFIVYAAVALLAALLYRGLSTSVELRALVPRSPLAKSRRTVLELSLLFSLDAMGGGFVIQTLLALWLFRRFDFSVQTTGVVFFAMNLLAAFSQLFSAPLAARIGLIRTMAYTHLPANVFLVTAAFMPNATWAVTFLLLRMSLSQMDVPARQSYVMSVVPPEERAAAASVTNVPRSLAAATTPLLAGAMLAHTTFGWPLVCGGAAKIIYDLLLLHQFQKRPV
jgi:MFS family permease